MTLTAQIEALIAEMQEKIAQHPDLHEGPSWLKRWASQLAALLPAVRELEEQKGVMPSERDSIADVSNSVPAVRTAIRRAEPPDTRLPVTTGEQHPDKNTATKLEAAEQRVRELETELARVNQEHENLHRYCDTITREHVDMEARALAAEQRVRELEWLLFGDARASP